MSTTEAFTDSLPDVRLKRLGMQRDVWGNDDPDVDVIAMRCQRDAESKRLGFPQRGYVTRATWTGDNGVADVWWTRTLKDAEATAVLLIEDRDAEPWQYARLMALCENDECVYAHGHMIPFKWVPTEQDWACPKCGVIG